MIIPETQVVGASGAQVVVRDNVAAKIGGPNVAAQGRWLMRNESPALPRVRRVYEDGYTMERLVEQRAPSSWDVFDRLRTCVWNADPEGHVSLDDVWRYAESQWELWPSAANAVRHYTMKLVPYWDDLRRCRIHGDPTWCNTMRRPNGDLVLIDPIPAKSYAPSLQAVDVGKILQSCYGYERVRFGWRAIDWEDECPWWFLELPWHERCASRMFALVHFMRLMRYMPDDDTRRRLCGIAQPLLRV